MRFDGSAALKLDFGGVTTTTPGLKGGRPGLRLAGARGLHGPEKYKELEHRRRQAQIKARHLLSLLDEVTEAVKMDEVTQAIKEEAS